MNVLGNFFRIGEKFPMKVLFCIQDFSFPTIRPKGWKPISYCSRILERSVLRSI